MYPFLQLDWTYTTITIISAEIIPVGWSRDETDASGLAGASPCRVGLSVRENSPGERWELDCCVRSEFIVSAFVECVARMPLHVGCARDVERLVEPSLESVVCRLLLRMFVPFLLCGTLFVPCRLMVKNERSISRSFIYIGNPMKGKKLM